ncbi:MAG TPA: hypothetical protein VMW24_04540 [Sedimentisphaerales bacterium]|nr:hypothetical protein [Sedimentisphaerales bacterium]
MVNEDFGAIVKVCVCAVFALSLCVVPSCKKSSEPAPPQVNEPTTPQTPAPSIVEPAVETTVSEAPAPTPAEPKVSPALAATAEGLVPVEIELPRPMFVGTPTDTRVPNLEKPLGKPRPPFLAPPGTKNLAAGKPVSGSDEEPIIGEIEMITDGDLEAADGSYVELGPFVQYVTIDLGAPCNIYAILAWHYHKEARVYFDVVARVADDPDFITNVKTVFNNDIDNSAGLGVGKDMHYVETNEGKLIDVLSQDVKARYVRLYSNGNTSNDLNHYIEVAVYGKPVE